MVGLKVSSGINILSKYFLLIIFLLSGSAVWVPEAGAAGGGLRCWKLHLPSAGGRPQHLCLRMWLLTTSCWICQSKRSIHKMYCVSHIYTCKSYFSEPFLWWHSALHSPKMIHFEKPECRTWWINGFLKDFFRNFLSPSFVDLKPPTFRLSCCRRSPLQETDSKVEVWYEAGQNKIKNAFCSQQNPLYCPERCCAFQCDLTKDDLRDNVPEGSVDVITLIFVLSAVHPDKMKLVLQNIGRVRAETAGGKQAFQIVWE